MNIQIRKATPSDNKPLSALCISVWVNTYCIEGISQAIAEYVLTNFTTDALMHKISDKKVLVAERNGAIVGTTVFDEATGEIETLYVLNHFKSMGIGRSLIDTLRRDYKSRIFLTTWEGNEAALTFYRKIGFITSGEAFFELDGQQIRNIELTLN